MLEPILLTVAQSRIILLLLLRNGLTSASLTSLARVSGASWNKHRERLEKLGLIKSEERKMLTPDGIKRVHHHSLTRRGVMVAKKLHEVSVIISPSLE